MLSDEVRSFSAALVALATLAGLLLAGFAVGEPWIAGLVFVLAAAWALRKRVSWVFPALVQYRSVLAERDSLKSEVTTRTAELQRAASLVRASFDRGVEEGRAQTVGGILAAVSAVPELRAVRLAGDDLRFHARVPVGSTVHAGARFVLQVSETEEEHGTLEVLDVDNTTGKLTLACVRQASELFWEKLTDRAAIEPSVPDGLVLVPPPTGSLRSITQDEKSKEQPTDG